MASITLTDFRARFPQFGSTDDYPDAFIQIRIDDTECEMSESVWGCFFAKGQAYLTAHYIAISDLTSGGTGVTGVGSGSAFGSQTHKSLSSESEGDTSVSYSSASGTAGIMAGAGTDELLASTLYGQQYIELRSKAIIGVASSGSAVNAVSRVSR